MKTFLTALAAALILAFGAATGALAEGYGKQKVVYHINYDGESGTSYRAAMNNIQNHINAVGAENIEVKVVLHGDGLGLLMSAKSDDALQTRVASLKGQNVGFSVCNNTLKGREISYQDDLYDVWEEDIVPSGVAELSKLQQEGYTYIKP
jgi:intracellular sulfur oxidation DsrE/DsrF family protein